MDTLTRYLDEELPHDSLLGHLVLYTIKDGDYERQQLAYWMLDLGLDVSYLPSGCTPIDAYRKATSEVDEFEYKLPDGNIAHILVRDVLSDDKLIERHLVREIRVSRKRTLRHNKVGEAVFYRQRIEKGKPVPDSHKFRLNMLRGELTRGELEPLQSVVKKIDESYNRHLNFLDGMKVRGMVRKYVKSLDGIELKPSVYFVPISQIENLTKVVALVDQLGEGCQMQTIGLVDTVKQRDVVIQAWQNETKDALKELVDRIAYLQDNRKTITPEAFGKLRAEYEAILERGRQYKKALAISTDVTTNAADMAWSQLESLAETMLSAPRKRGRKKKSEEVRR